MGDEKRACSWLSVNAVTETDSRLTCILIDDEYVALPDVFNAEILDCCVQGKSHLALAVDDRAAADFAGRLEIAAAMGKEIKLLHALLTPEELDGVSESIEAQQPIWRERDSRIKCWSIFPHSCECANRQNGKKINLFNLIKSNGQNERNGDNR